MIKKYAGLLIFVMMISACSSTGSKTSSVYDTEPGEVEAQAQSADDEDTPMDSLAFADLKIFDKELSRAMKTDNDEIEVALISKFTTNEIPERLGKWIYMVDKHEGKVEMESTDPTKRGIPGIGAGIGLMISAIGAVRDKIMYGPSKNYDATLLYEPESGIVEKIVFRRKQ
ncbi:MAG: hypothetical protein CMI55_04770 [Parcubacteria group bacterium]|nr:hypothetical protein [Parcubacteria group bacterium]